jgi:iron(III) transport system ATP-binding protein
MIRITNLSKQFASTAAAAIADLSLEIPTGAFFTLLGPSGCGKSTTLRCIAGLERADAGEIRFDDQVVFSARDGINVPAYRRRIGMVFQSYAIWPHMSVRQNVEYPLLNVAKSERMTRDEIKDAAMDALRLVSMDHLAERSAPLLSGGEQQRVAVARALVQNPKILLLDEPLSNLDARLRDQMRFELRDLHSRLSITTVYVTHDQDEAFSLSDAMAVMSKGRLLELGRPEDVYRVSSTSFAAEFLGTASKVAGTVVGRSTGDAVVVRTAIGEFTCRSRHQLADGDQVWVYIRPEEVTPDLDGASAISGPDLTVVPATITRATFLGGDTEWVADAAGATIKGRSFSDSPAGLYVRRQLGKPVSLRISGVRCLPIGE